MEDIDPTNEDGVTPVGGVDRRTMFIALGALATAAVVLAFLRVRMEAKARPATVDIPSFDVDGADWKTSLTHVADAFRTVTNGLSERLDDIDAKLVTLAAPTTIGPDVPVPSVLPNRDVPPPPVPVTQPAPVIDNGAPPGTASVSL